jgi:2-keto-3-deoxy-L-rhamnonate aldolase RhmA
VRTNHFKEVTRAHGLALGVSLTIGDPFVAEIVGAGAPDFVMIDTEHAPLTPDHLQGILIALKTSAATSLVRVAANDEALVGQALDLGAEGVIIPGVVDGASCRAAVAATRYGPRGTRGLGPRRAARLEGGRAAYLERADDEICAVVMVEHIAALDNLDDILAIDELDAVMAGPADLAASMGQLTDPGHPDVGKAVEVVLDACKRHRVPFGIFAASEAGARTWATRGASFIVIGADLQYLDQGLTRANTLAGELRATLSE